MLCHVPLDLQCVYGYNDERGESGDWEDGNKVFGGRKSGDSLVSCMQMTWLCVVSRRRT